MRFIDAHTHAQFAAFGDGSKEVIDRALENGIWLINVGTQQDTSRLAVEIAKRYPEGVYATVGLHPIHTAKSFHDAQELGDTADAKGFTSRGEEFDYDYYKKLAQDPKVVAIGECGLDYAAFARERSERLQKRAPAEAFSEGGLSPDEVHQRKEKQKQAFIRQIELAAEVKKPLMIHCRSGAPERASPQNEAGRNAFTDLIDILSSFHSSLSSMPSPGVIHFFTGTAEDAKKLLAMGFYFTFGGAITFPPRLAARSRGEAGAPNYEEIIKILPLN
ncbi:MAG: TatD family hydrolase, partial [Patescibacteria group bacterium]